MDAVSDSPFRQICQSLGADLLYTEFVQSTPLIHGARKTVRKLTFHESERPLGIQIYGGDETVMREATAIAEAAAPDFIDINCGCWVKRIAERGDGAGLLRDLGRFERVVRTVVENTTLPVTVKTRLGWDAEHIVILDVARMLEQTGAQALTVHCRTRSQGYDGEADWTWLERIKGVTALPLIGNGDVCTAEDARRMFATGCDGVMIGRVAIQNPWIFREARHLVDHGVSAPPPTLEEQIAVCLRHLRGLCAYSGEERGVRKFRKWYTGYLAGLPDLEAVQRELVTIDSLAAVERRLTGLVDAMSPSF